jgi:PAS domain S-box-containing protein
MLAGREPLSGGRRLQCRPPTRHQGAGLMVGLRRGAVGEGQRNILPADAFHTVGYCGKLGPRLKRIEDLDSARRLQLMVDGVVDYALYLINLDGLIVSWNSGAERLKGYQASEVIGTSFANFFTPEDRERGLPQTALQTAAEAGRFETEGWRVRKDGSRFWALAVVDAVRDEEGSLIGFVKITRDMTERRQARETLIASEERFRRLVQAVVDYAIFQLDPDGIVITWNPGAQRIKGYAAEDIIGQHFSRFYTDEDRTAGTPGKALETAKRDGRYEAEGWRVRKDGSKFCALVVIDPIYGDRGELLGFAKVTRDITERVTAQRVLKETQNQLAASQKLEAVGQLSGGIAHDFNNLLMIVLGNLETAQRHARGAGSGANPNLERAINNAMRGAQRAAALTSRLLAFSRRQALDPKPLDVNKFLSGAADFLQRSLGELIQVEVVGAAGAWQVEVDVNQLEAALVNLALNARDAMPAGGKLTLEVTNVFADEAYCRVNPELVPGQYVLIAVTDQGCGMPRDILDRAIEPFFTTKEVGHGTGLGLSQVYGFVKQSGGHIKIYSEVDQGTTVKVYLPRNRHSRFDEPDVEPEAISFGESEVILVVEDDSDLRAYLSEVLRSLGYQVLTAPHAQAALPLLEQAGRRIDLLLTDVVMPGMNGRELGHRAHELRPDLRVLYMTGYSRNAIVHQDRLDEGVELLPKPITQTSLASRIRDVLDDRRRLN